jgi:hypothetical protein
LGENTAVVQGNFKERARRWLQIVEKFAISGII